MRKSTTGFTLVELLAVIVVIAILAAISVVAFNGVQVRAKNAKLQTDIKNVQQYIEAYNAENGMYPVTQPNTLTSGSWADGSIAYADANCPYTFKDYLGLTHTVKTAAWVPGLAVSLPQSNGEKRGTTWGCFLYQSDGNKYVLSAWNMVAGGPQTNTFYRRVGFREMGQGFQVYYCNAGSIGGNRTGTYDIDTDFYKYSYTVSNITCNETPPLGA